MEEQLEIGESDGAEQSETEIILDEETELEHDIHGKDKITKWLLSVPRSNVIIRSHSILCRLSRVKASAKNRKPAIS